MATFTGYTAEVVVDDGVVTITPRGPGRLNGRQRALRMEDILRVEIQEPRRLLNGEVNIVDADWRGKSDRALFTWQQREQFAALVKSLAGAGLAVTRQSS